MVLYVSYSFKKDGAIGIGNCTINTEAKRITLEDFSTLKEMIQDRISEQDIMILGVTKLPIEEV